jgi:hypothetical protein
MKIILVIFLMLCSLVVNAQAPFPVYEKTIELPGNIEYFLGEWNPTLTQTQPGGMLITARFDDFDAPFGGYNFRVLQHNGRVYPLFPLNRWGLNVLTGYTMLYYPTKISPGKAYMPVWLASSLFGSHRVEMHGQIKEEKSFGNWMLQTDKRWANELYGKYKNTTISKYGCCFISYCMAESAWLGRDIDPIDANDYLHSQKDGYMGKSGLLVNGGAMARYATERLGFPMRLVSSGMSLSESLSRGLSPIAKYNNRGHWAMAYGKRWNGKSFDYLNWDPMGRGYYDTVAGYGGLSENNTRVLIPVVERLTSTAMVARDGDYEPGKLPMCVALAPEITRVTPAARTISQDYGQSSIIAFVDSGNVSLSLWYRQMPIAQSITEHIESCDGTNSIGETIMEVYNLPLGSYMLQISGMPKQSYRVVVWEYNYHGDLLDRVITGVIPYSRNRFVNILHM